jgi:HrpA-like RNA helicase
MAGAGVIEAKCIALVRNLPKAPAQELRAGAGFIKAALQRMTFAEGSLPQSLGRELLRMTGARVSDEAGRKRRSGSKAICDEPGNRRRPRQVPR